MTSTQTGDKWVGELLAGHPTRFHIAFRMSPQIFTDLLYLLQTSYGLQGSQRTTAREVLAITIYTLAHKGSMRLTSERFQHSTETISRFFAIGLDALTLLAAEMIKPLDPQFMNIPAKILNDDRYMPYFKDCIGAIDGTHVDACVPVDDQVRYIGRHGTPTQNIMAICDFDMCFTYVVPGWEGSAHDSRIFQRAVNDPSCEFPHPPPDELIRCLEHQRVFDQVLTNQRS
ncbi:hypothetical protein KSP39_PZI017946 [Platanthera zijinensis]|uniref:DDE Tnp4 domain-containing protein n=1 Tax=Platanthera zijinensis TaxID=2320716 RepID=A0AAP0FZU4_9ASPA